VRRLRWHTVKKKTAKTMTLLSSSTAISTTRNVNSLKENAARLETCLPIRLMSRSSLQLVSINPTFSFRHPLVQVSLLLLLKTYNTLLSYPHTLYYSFNILPLSLDLVIRYKILEPSSCEGKKEDVIQKGSTNILQNYAVLETSIKFLAFFFVVSICVIFVSAIYYLHAMPAALILLLSLVSRIL
jgi:hypothetical protein